MVSKSQALATKDPEGLRSFGTRLHRTSPSEPRKAELRLPSTAPNGPDWVALARLPQSTETRSYGCRQA